MASVRIDPKVGRIQKLPPRAPQEQARVFAAAARQVAAQQDIIASSFKEEQRIKIGCQGIMEEALFDFCQKWCKDLLHDEQWHSADMAELHLFRNLSKYRLNVRAINNSQGSHLSWAQVLDHIEELKMLRHAAVHRHSLTIPDLQRLLKFALTLLEAIQDKKRHAKMSLIIEHINSKEWEKVYEFIDMPLEKVPVKAWYGREVQTTDLTGDDDEEEESSQTARPAEEPSSPRSSQKKEDVPPASLMQAPVPNGMGGAFGAQPFGSQVFGAQVFGSQAFGGQVFGSQAFGAQVFGQPAFSSFAVPKPTPSLFQATVDASGAGNGPASSSKVAPIVPVVQKQMNTKTSKEERKERRRRPPRGSKKKTRTMASAAEAVKKDPVIIDLTGED